MQQLKSKHASDYQDGELQQEKKIETNPSKEPSKQPTLHQSIQQFQPYICKRHKKLYTSLVDKIAVDIQPTSIIEDKGFHKFVNALDPRYAFPSRRTIMRSMLPAKYEHVREGLKDQLSQCTVLCTYL